MSIHVYVHTCLHMYARMCVYMYVHMCICAYVCVHIFEYVYKICICMCVCAFEYICVYAYMCMSAYVYVCICMPGQASDFLMARIFLSKMILQKHSGTEEMAQQLRVILALAENLGLVSSTRVGQLTTSCHSRRSSVLF